MNGVIVQGGDVIDVGLVDTPFVYFAINHLDCAGGVVATASHNPPNYNGFKISRRSAKPIGEATGLQEIRKFAAMVDPKATHESKGRIEKRDLWDAYRQHVLSFLDLSALRNSKVLKVVVDASNAMAGTMVPRIFGKGGDAIDRLDIVELNFDNTKGEFAHEPNPLVAANLKQLQEAVVAEKADLGICFDGDADRCMIVDENGDIVNCDLLTAVMAKHFLGKGRGGAVIYDLRSSKAVEEEIVAAGGTPVRSRVGHVFMKQAMAQHRAVFGGEVSGHFYFRDNFNADSGAIAMATILTIRASTNKKISTLIKPVARYAQSGEINFECEEQDEAIEAVEEAYLDAAEIDYLDGITVDAFNTKGWWFNVRKSNTEPLLRLNAEAKDQKTLDTLIQNLAPKLGQRVDH
jgi:phosphomannomutase